MTENDHEEGFYLARSIRVRITIVVFTVLGFFLFSSELVNSIFNNYLDSIDASIGQRILFAFKPTVAAIYVVFAFGVVRLIFRYIRPLFRYLETGEDYTRARSAANAVPRVIILFQILAWTIGTTVYYIISGWQADSGIPFAFGLPLKIAVGLPAAIYTSILFNIILVPVKQYMRIIDVRPGEDDTFSRYRDFYVIIAVVVFIAVNFNYIVYYYAQDAVVVTFQSLYLPLLGLSLFYVAVAVGLVALSKWEYFMQIGSITAALQEMASGKTDVDRRIEISSFNELGEISAHVNSILDTFHDLLRKINGIAQHLSDSSQRLASASQENASYSNQQASSTAEIVSTMEDVNKLSEEIGQQVHQVEESAGVVKERVQEGFQITKQNIGKMQEVTDSYADTIGGMKNLGEHISGIWEIVKIINGIAGQIKIIAFNAALEASSAGEAGKNFEIVAGEIRRLADSTVSSTNEIRTRIGDIQDASDALVNSTEADSIKIQDASRMSNTLESVFESILEASDATSSATQEMTRGVDQQINAFEQVLITSRQISEAVSEFAGSIEDSSATAETLEDTVETLTNIVETSTMTSEESTGRTQS